MSLCRYHASKLLVRNVLNAVVEQLMNCIYDVFRQESMKDGEFQDLSPTQSHRARHYLLFFLGVFTRMEYIEVPDAITTQYHNLVHFFEM